jgi:hypothetical protein
MRLRSGLLAVDRQEAVGNVETSLSSVLNAFHSLYDAIEKELGDHSVDWYSTPELATVLALRNARHHNKANRTRPFAISVQQGAVTPVYLASSPNVEGITGGYFVKCKATVPSTAGQDGEAAARLWKVSAEITGVGPAVSRP